MPFGEAKLLWGFDGSQWGAMAPTRRCIAKDMASMRDGEGVRLDLGMKWRSRRHVVGA